MKKSTGRIQHKRPILERPVAEEYNTSYIHQEISVMVVFTILMDSTSPRESNEGILVDISAASSPNVRVKVRVRVRTKVRVRIRA